MDADARAVRDLVYMTLAQEGRTPSVAELARRTGSTAGAVQSTLRSLADAHALVLTSDQDAVRMAHPFSAAPMAFVVTPTDGLDDRRWWGGCALFPPVGCDRRSPLRMASYASPRRVPLCGSGRGPVSVHPHAARFPRPTDSAGRADIVGDRRAAGLPGRRCCIQPRRPVHVLGVDHDGRWWPVVTSQNADRFGSGVAAWPDPTDTLRRCISLRD